MEKMCNNSIGNARSNEIKNESSYQMSPLKLSPVFAIVPTFKKVRCNQSPEDDIPSYQIPRDSKRFSDISEEQDSILPISPVRTPPSVKKCEDFMEPLIHTIGTIVKKNGDSKVTLNEEEPNVNVNGPSKKFGSVFEELGMLDKDISWNSAMETPAPHPLTLKEYNTIERATLLPEVDAKSMQPRALFSPHKDDDLDCMPLKYSSDSEGDEPSNADKILNKCGNMKEINPLQEWNDDDTLIGSPTICPSPKRSTAKESATEKEVITSPLSPIFKVEKKKKKSKMKNMRALLIKSPVIHDGCADEVIHNNKIEYNKDISVDVTENELNKRNDNKKQNSYFSEQSNSIQDDSFQDLSFSYIDELCKSSACLSDCNTNNCSSLANKENELPSESAKSSLVKGKINQIKFFYQNTDKSDELRPVSSVDDFLKSAKRLEEDNNMLEKKTVEKLNNDELTVFNKMPRQEREGSESVGVAKRMRYTNSPEKSPSKLRENKVIKLESDVISEFSESELATSASYDNLQDIDSHFDANDSEMCVTADYAESLINDPKFTGNNFTTCINYGTNKEDNSNFNVANEMSCNINAIEENSNKKSNFPMFCTASGSTISISNDALEKVKHIFKEEYEENHVIKSEFSKLDEVEKKEEAQISNINKFQGFKMASGAAVKISDKSLNKAKNLLKEIMDEPDCVDLPAVENFGFSTASGRKIKVSEESLNKARNILNQEDLENDLKRVEDSKKVKVESKSEVPECVVGFMTASNKKVEISKDCLKKAQALWKGEEDLKEDYFNDPEDLKSFPENLTLTDQISELTQRPEVVKPLQEFCGFSTASGKNIAVSCKALTNAKKILGEIETDSIDENSSFAVKIEEVAAKEDKISLPTETLTTPDNNLEDFEEIIPEWLHAYNTSPTFTVDRLELEAVTSFEDCRHSTPREQYLVKSPILGTTDRFYSKRKRRNPGRKLIFDPSPKLENISDFKPSFNLPYKNPSAKRNASDGNIDFSVPFKRRRLNDSAAMTSFTSKENEKLSDDIKEGRINARLEQMRAGKKGKEKPVKGSHLTKKSEPQVSWYKAVEGAFPDNYSEETLLKHGIREDTLTITCSTAADYKFKATNHFSLTDSFSNVKGFPAGDGCLLIFDDLNLAGVEEFARAFFASPGVEPNLITVEWVKNHYKWIVWKLSHYERAFPHIFGGKCLTPHNVLVQLKYRYDREIDRSQRSALKKILERDDSSAKKMVLCVSDIKKTSNLDSNTSDVSLNKSLVAFTLGLTDGWYSCYAQTDSAMTRLIEEGKVAVGTKLIMQGAELLNCDKGVSPLEASGNVHLKISTNSTRRARWDVKLGFYKNSSPLLVSLNSILPNGGLVSRIDVIIARIYPLLYMEKKSDGTHVMRNGRMEDRAVAAYQQEREATLEKIYQKVQDEFKNKEKEKEKRKGKLSMSNISEILDAEELYILYENCSDPSAFHSRLTSKQKEILIDYQRMKSEMSNKELSELVQDKIKSENMNIRKVSQLLRIRIVDLHKRNYANPVLFTVWNSMEDVSRIFTEGKAISIFNATPGNSRFLNSVQLNSTRQTRYKELSESVDYPARRLTSLNELIDDYDHDFNEVDIVGIVVAVHENSQGSKLSQTIFLADENLNFAGIVFWGSCKDFGWENILTVSSIVACSNLQCNKKKNNNCIPSVYVNDTSVFTENPKQNYLKEEIKRIRTSLPDDRKAFISKCDEEITAKLEEMKQNSNTSRNSTIPNDASLNSSFNQKPKYINGFRTKPNASSTPLKSASFGLDTSGQEPSPIQKRIEKLQMYGEPPPLSPLLPLDNLEKFKTKFRVPFKSASSRDSNNK